MRKSTLIVGGALVAALVVGTGGGAYAAAKITGADIVDGTITGGDIKNESLNVGDLTEKAQHALKGAKGATGARGPAGAPGAKGVPGDSRMAGAYYSVAFYDVGDTNAGAIATVACKAQADTAISGGVQVLGLDAGANSRNTPVSSSFPGRMDWNTNAPKADRLDGWIVQFGGTTLAPEKVKVWALCVPGMTIPVEQTYTQSS